MADFDLVILGGGSGGYAAALRASQLGQKVVLIEKDKFWNNIPIIFSILYRPIVKKSGKYYTIEPYAGTNDERIDFFKDILTMDIVFGAIGFFLNLQSDLLIGILHYSEKILKKTKDPQVSLLLETLAKNGVDIPQLQSSLTTTLQNLILLRSYQSTNALPS